MNTVKQLKHSRRPVLLHPDLGAWAGLLFLLCCVFMFAWQRIPSFPAPVPLVHIPSYTSYEVCGMREGSPVVISVDAAHRFYVAAYDNSMQAAIVKAVAKQHHVSFTTSQLRELRKIPFVNQDIRQLPAWLSAVETTGRQPFPVGIPSSADDNQVADYIAATIQASEAIHHRPAVFDLRLDASLSGAQVQEVFQLLQNHGIQYFNLILERK